MVGLTCALVFVKRVERFEVALAAVWTHGRATDTMHCTQMEDKGGLALLLVDGVAELADELQQSRRVSVGKGRHRPPRDAVWLSIETNKT